MELTGKQKRYLRSLGTSLKASKQIGKEGITNTVLDDLENNITKNELVKIHVLPTSEMTKEEIIDVLNFHKFTVVQAIGSMILVYRPNYELKDHIILP